MCTYIYIHKYLYPSNGWLSRENDGNGEILELLGTRHLQINPENGHFYIESILSTEDLT